MQINAVFDNLDELEEFARLVLYSPSLRKPGSETIMPESSIKPEIKDNVLTHQPPAAEERKNAYDEADISAEKAKKPVKKRNLLDKGKINALHNAGWDAKKIADEMRCSTWSVYNAIHGYKK